MRANWQQELRALGRRVTKQRLAVLETVQCAPHASADIVFAHLKDDIPTLTVQSVYIILTDLSDIGMLRKFEPPASPALYETRINDNHHHAYCIKCHRIADVACAIGASPCLTPSTSHGMKLLSAEVLYRGICEPCQQELHATTEADLL
ncbi:MAG: Fur family transcriptional regulator [Microbacteriaceae bacterium]|nr:Fur family transcriptional regulator [Microbacteriaceae bacterium]